MTRIIVADDDDIVTDLVREVLSSAGYVVGAVDNGADALRAIRAKRPDLVILDCNMPQKNGLLVLREMRVSDEFYRTPVLVLTARHSARDVQLAYNQGANGYIKKPFDPEELLFKVGDLLSAGVHHAHFGLEHSSSSPPAPSWS